MEGEWQEGRRISKYDTRHEPLGAILSAVFITLTLALSHSYHSSCHSLLQPPSTDTQVKLWDTRLDPDTALLATLQGHKQCVNKVGWLRYWWCAQCCVALCTLSRTHTCVESRC